MDVDPRVSPLVVIQTALPLRSHDAAEPRCALCGCIAPIFSDQIGGIYCQRCGEAERSASRGAYEIRAGSSTSKPPKPSASRSRSRCCCARIKS